jgi:acyl-CoA synthetase (AMP-forming)/AMP-acid ligase II
VLLPPGDGHGRAVLFAVTGLQAAEVLDGMRGLIEEFKIPHRCLIVDELPLTGNGKIDRRALAAMALPESGDGHAAA